MGESTVVQWFNTTYNIYPFLTRDHSGSFLPASVFGEAEDAAEHFSSWTPRTEARPKVGAVFFSPRLHFLEHSLNGSSIAWASNWIQIGLFEMGISFHVNWLARWSLQENYSEDISHFLEFTFFFSALISAWLRVWPRQNPWTQMDLRAVKSPNVAGKWSWEMMRLLPWLPGFPEI